MPSQQEQLAMLAQVAPLLQQRSGGLNEIAQLMQIAQMPQQAAVPGQQLALQEQAMQQRGEQFSQQHSIALQQLALAQAEAQRQQQAQEEAMRQFGVQTGLAQERLGLEREQNESLSALRVLQGQAMQSQIPINEEQLQRMRLINQLFAGQGANSGASPEEQQTIFNLLNQQQ